jgi:hypothetical protein
MDKGWPMRSRIFKNLRRIENQTDDVNAEFEVELPG